MLSERDGVTELVARPDATELSGFESELTRGHPELVQHYRLYIRSAAFPNFDMVWLYRSPIPVGRRGVFYAFKLFLPALTAFRERGLGQQ